MQQIVEKAVGLPVKLAREAGLILMESLGAGPEIELKGEQELLRDGSVEA